MSNKDSVIDEKKHSQHENFDYKGIEMQSTKNNEDQTDIDHGKKSTLTSGLNLDQQYENANPEVIADDEYDANVTCKTPLKYIKQKWCCRRERQIRYKVNNK